MLYAAVNTRSILAGAKVLIHWRGMKSPVHQLTQGNTGVTIFLKAKTAALPKANFLSRFRKDLGRSLFLYHDTAVAGRGHFKNAGANGLAGLNNAPGGE